MLNRDKPYRFQWCTVDVDNAFTYNNIGYIIDKSVEAYAVFNVPQTNDAAMDKILVLEQDGRLFFYDQKWNPLHPEQVQMIAGSPIARKGGKIE